MFDPNQFMRDLKNVDQARVDGQNQLARSINQIGAQQAKILQKEQMATLKEFFTHAFSRSISYTQIIMAAGYAAFFTVWTSVKTDLTKTFIYSSGLLVTLSVLLFIMAEVHKMLSTGRHYRKIYKEIFSNPTPDLIEKIQKAEQTHENRMHKVWYCIFFPTLITGLSGGMILIVGFAQGLLKELLK